MTMTTKTIADLTAALGLPASEQTAVAAWCELEQREMFTVAGEMLPCFTEQDVIELRVLWHEGVAAAPVEDYPVIFRTQLEGTDGDGKRTAILLDTSVDPEDGPPAIELDVTERGVMTITFLTEAQAVMLREALGNHIARLRERSGR
jgi:hypothetical protein